MRQLNLTDVSKYVEDNIGIFHQKRIASIDALSLSKVLKRKNPYLFKAKYVLTAEIIEPLGNNAKRRNDEFLQSYSMMINKFTREFSNDFCDDDGAINWQKLVRFNSSK